MAKRAKPQKAKKAKGGQPSARKQRGAKMRMAGPSMSHVMQACSITNPFCPEANTGRWPDNSYTKSLCTNVIAQSVNVHANTSGWSAVMFVGDINAYALPANDTLLTAVTFPTLTALTVSAGQRYRVTSWGLKITAPYQSQINTYGVVSVRLFSPMTGASLATCNCASTFADESMDVPLASLINKPLLVVPKPLGDNARLFRDTSSAVTTMSTWVNPGWQVVTVAVNGTFTSADMLRVEMFYHFETIPADGDSSYAYAIAPPRESLAVQHANSNVLADIPSIIESGFEKLDRVITSKSAKYLGTALATFLGGPAVGGSTFGALTIADQRGRIVD